MNACLVLEPTLLVKAMAAVAGGLRTDTGERQGAGPRDDCAAERGPGVLGRTAGVDAGEDVRPTPKTKVALTTLTSESESPLAQLAGISLQLELLHEGFAAVRVAHAQRSYCTLKLSIRARAPLPQQR